MGTKKPENIAHNNLFGGTLVKKNLIMLLAILALTVSCKDDAPKAVEQPVSEKPAAAQSAVGGFTGTALEIMKADRYTYVQVDTGIEKIWAATPEFLGKVGDTVVVPKGLAMQNFHSKTLERDFEVVYFVGAITVAGNDQGPSQMARTSFMHPPKSGKSSKSQTEVGGIKRAKDGKNVAEIFAGSKDLAGEQVTVRGKVVKFLPQIMGKNWLHLQDGSGSEGTNDLTVTTGTTVKVGDLVLVSGVVSVDRDFGYGYSYDVIIEDARVTVE
jgi:hypothetical protein